MNTHFHLFDIVLTALGAALTTWWLDSPVLGVICTLGGALLGRCIARAIIKLADAH